MYIHDTFLCKTATLIQILSHPQTIHNFCFELLKISWINCFINLVLGNFVSWEKCSCNPLHPNINLHILHTDLITFPKVLTRRIICLTIKTFFSLWSFTLSCDLNDPLMCDSGVIFLGEIRCKSLKRVKQLNWWILWMQLCHCLWITFHLPFKRVHNLENL